jgi:hypothetical protein
LPLVVYSEPAQPPNVALAAAMETEVEWLRRYLEVSQGTLETAKREMQAV